VSSRGRRTGLSAPKAKALKPLLDSFVDRYPRGERMAFDPVEIPHRYSDPRDIEVSALICASLAYGRVDLFKPKLQWLHEKMGASPAEYVRELTVARAAKDLRGFVYRFNVPADLAVLLLGIGQALRRHGSLESLFVAHLGEDLQLTLREFTAELRDVPMKELRRALGKERGLHHLLPSPANTGAAKRLNLYLRWMVRGPDEVDFGIWTRVPAAKLLIPLDTHIARISKHLGLTKRKDLSWRTAEEITASLRLLDPEDPVRYDFALCHYGMSGLCPVAPRREQCERCGLLGSCSTGPKILRR
jgi:uncharacterized protein (TIGR02757 family)